MFVLDTNVISELMRPEPDTVVTAIASAQKMAVVTRNVPDFNGIGIKVVNPWIQAQPRSQRPDVLSGDRLANPDHRQPGTRRDISINRFKPELYKFDNNLTRCLMLPISGITNQRMKISRKIYRQKPQVIIVMI